MENPDKSFRLPEIRDKHTGLYVTEAQLKLFLCGPNGMSMIENDNPIWVKYKRACEIWNILYDSLGEEVVNDNGFLTWDSDNECLKVEILSGSPIELYLIEHGIEL